MDKQPLILLPAIGLGTSRLGHHRTTTKALYHLDFAFDQGIRYFDTAPIYTYGWSERLIGTFHQGKRDKLVITTKIGLYPSPLLSALPFGLLNRVRQMAKIIRRKGSQGLPPGVSPQSSKAFDSKSALSSVHASLKRLKTDYIDTLLLHEATVDEANQPEALEFMEQVKASGMVRAVGIGSARNKLSNLNHLDPLYTVVQHEFDILSPLAPLPGNRMHNTHGLLVQVKRIQTVFQNTDINVEIQKVCNLDLTNAADRLNFCLSGARYTHPTGITLFSSTSQNHIKDTIRAWENPVLNAAQFQQASAIIRKHIERI